MEHLEWQGEWPLLLRCSASHLASTECLCWAHLCRGQRVRRVWRGPPARGKPDADRQLAPASVGSLVGGRGCARCKVWLEPQPCFIPALEGAQARDGAREGVEMHNHAMATPVLPSAMGDEYAVWQRLIGLAFQLTALELGTDPISLQATAVRLLCRRRARSRIAGVWQSSTRARTRLSSPRRRRLVLCATSSLFPAPQSQGVLDGAAWQAVSRHSAKRRDCRQEPAPPRNGALNAPPCQCMRYRLAGMSSAATH